MSTANAGSHTAPAGRLSAGAGSLLLSARRWMDEALTGWEDGDLGRTASLVPLADEYLAQAVLWQINPVLVVPLAPDNESALVQQATAPSLDTPGLRAIELTQGLPRLEAVLGKPTPLDSEATDRLLAYRRSPIRAGSSDFGATREVLIDAVILADWLLEALGCPPEAFYGDHLSLSRTLGDRATAGEGNATDHTVTVALGRARRQLAATRAGVDDSQAADVEARRERDHLEMYSKVTGSGVDGRAELMITARCPVCEHQGVILGEADVNAAGERRGRTSSSPTYDVILTPYAFECGVCGLRLWGPEELKASPLPSDRTRLPEADWGTFDPAVFLRSRD